jgi:hypothetical protein
MGFRIVATIAAVDSLAFGIAGLVFPAQLASAIAGELDPLALTIVRLAAASYVGYGVLAWLVRDRQDARTIQAVCLANAVSWGLSAVVFAAALLSGLGGTVLWAIVAMQVAFAVAWLVPLRRPRAAVARSA